MILTERFEYEKEMGRKRIVLSVDDDNEFRTRCVVVVWFFIDTKNKG